VTENSAAIQQLLNIIPAWNMSSVDWSMIFLTIMIVKHNKLVGQREEEIEKLCRGGALVVRMNFTTTLYFRTSFDLHFSLGAEIHL
jgi:hypothetical protein